MAKAKAPAGKKVEESKRGKRKVESEEDESENDSNSSPAPKSKRGAKVAKKSPASKGKKRKAADSESEKDEESDDENNGSQSEKSDNGKSGDDSDNNNSDNDDEDSAESDNGDEHGTRSHDKSQSKSKTKATKVTKTTKKVVKKTKVEATTSSRGKSKVPSKLERVTEASKAFLWWKAKELADGINWAYMEHPGINFAPPYVPHNIPLYYDGKPIQLEPEQEEIVSFYAALPVDGPQLGIPKTAAVFQKNFFDDFKATLTPGHEIKNFAKMNFDMIRTHLDKQKSLKKAATDEEKQARKAEKEETMNRMNWCHMDGRIEKVSEWHL